MNPDEIIADMRPAKEIEIWETGVLRWFDPVRRFGFIIADDDGGDVYLHFTTLQKSNIRECEAQQGIRVSYKAIPDGLGKRPRATRVRILK